MTNQQLGRWGEAAAEQYLREAGYTIQCRNYACREGELDIVAQKDGILHVVEVKTRRGDTFGSPAESITPRKQYRMKRAAVAYLSAMRGRIGSLPPARIQLDAIEIRINHIEDF